MNGCREQESTQMCSLPSMLTGAPLTQHSLLWWKAPPSLLAMPSQRKASPWLSLCSLQVASFSFSQVRDGFAVSPPFSLLGLALPICLRKRLRRVFPGGPCLLNLFPLSDSQSLSLFDLPGPAFPAAPWGSMKGE